MLNVKPYSYNYLIELWSSRNGNHFPQLCFISFRHLCKNLQVCCESLRRVHTNLKPG